MTAATYFALEDVSTHFPYFFAGGGGGVGRMSWAGRVTWDARAIMLRLSRHCRA